MLIITVGFDQADALTIVAGEYPDQNFAIVDMVVDLPNVASLTFRANEGSFLLDGETRDAISPARCGGMTLATDASATRPSPFSRSASSAPRCFASRRASTLVR